MKRTALPILLFTFSLLLLLALPSCINMLTVNAQTDTLFSVDIQVDHTVQIKDGGLVVINDTIRLSTEQGQNIEPLQNFSIGFPFEYKSNLDHCFAYDASNPDERLEVALDVGLGRIGFYGVNVLFPGSGIDISDGGSYNFTVAFVFSNIVSSEVSAANGEETASFTVDFPLYASVTEDVSKCNVTVILPYGANYTASSFEENGVVFNKTTHNLHQILNLTQSPLESFSYEQTWLRFYALPDHTLYLISVDEVKRDIALDEWGHVLLSDSYYLTNEGGSYRPVVLLPQGAYDVSARDTSGDLEVDVEKGNATSYTSATIYQDIDHKVSARFTVSYRLPREIYIDQRSWRDFVLAFSFFEGFDWKIKELTVIMGLPEGAEFQLDACYPKPQSVEKGVFQETIVFTFYNVTPFHDLDLSLTYRYVMFWASFRPTLWMGILIAIVCAAVFLWRAPRLPSGPIIPVPTEVLKTFFDSYKEKRRILGDLESLEQQVRKRKISRRRYKVRRRGLESRVSVLSRDLTGLREKIRKAGPRYANTMRQIEAAETELEGAEAAIRRIEIRYRHRELSTETYRTQIAEYNRRRERAKTTIDGVLLRLREEIS
ncbi:MAG: hypothetical protein JSV15_04460 [Candidatus Bathyarchaeota archaeon]|nr:MAG: hypothetical protein JSV15_04460 [Candidatus Bathyarchaeota archaeon]